MANPNIDLLGAVYPAVAGVTLPTQGGGTATFPWVEGSQSITQNGTVDVTNLAEVVVNVSGGGGASNIVTGTFKGTTTGTAFDISLPYTGSGFPIAVIVYPTDSNFNDLIHRYVLGVYCIVKKDPSLTPSYSSDSTYDLADVLYTYKSSVSNATVYTVAGNLAHNGPYKNGDANYNNGRRLEIRSSTKMSVYIAGSSTYGFAADIKYTYHVIYSS